MTYVTANLHGDAAGFQRLLQAISFKDKDILYVLGDSVDIGEDPMGLLIDMSMRENVFPLAGEHDLTALRLLSGFEKALKNGGSFTPDFASDMMMWHRNGGDPTLNGYRALDADMREGVIDYLSEFALCDEIEVKGQTYVLAHAGLANFSEDKYPEDYTPEDVFEPVLPDPSFFESRTLIVGHIPTASNKIERRDGVIYLDCGAAREGRIGCLCLETGEEYYA